MDDARSSDAWLVQPSTWDAPGCVWCILAATMGRQTKASRKGGTQATKGRSARGRATRSPDIEYQGLCCSIVQFMSAELGLEPYSGDETDVPISVAGTSVTFDVALKSEDGGHLFIGECKRWKKVIDQGHVFELAGKRDALAKKTGLRVEAAFFSKTGFRRGGLQAAPGLGIKVWEVREGQSSKAFTIASPTYDPATRRQRRDWGIGIAESIHTQDVPTVVIGSPSEPAGDQER